MTSLVSRPSLERSASIALLIVASIVLVSPADAQTCSVITPEACATAQEAPNGAGDSAGTIRLSCDDPRSLPINTPLRIYFDAFGLSGSWYYEVYRAGVGNPVITGVVPTTHADIGIPGVGDYSFRVALLNDCGQQVCGFSKSCRFSVLENAPMILRFTATPASIVVGQSSTLTWMTSGTRDAFIHPLGSVSTNGSIVVTPTTTTTYRLAISGGVEALVTVEVTADTCSIAPTNQTVALDYRGSSANCASTSDSPSCTPNQSVEFNALAIGYTFAGCETVSWDFGDGAVAEGRSVSHRFASSGLYRVRMTVVNRSGQAVVETMVRVTAAKRRSVRK